MFETPEEQKIIQDSKIKEKNIASQHEQKLREIKDKQKVTLNAQ